MLIFLILTHFATIQCQELSQLIKNQHVYVPREDALSYQLDNDDSKNLEMTTEGAHDDVESESKDDAEDNDKDDDPDPHLNRVKAQEFINPEDNVTNWVSIQYRPTKAMTTIRTTSSALPKSVTRNPPLLQDSVLPYSEEPWPTLTVSTFAVMLPIMPTLPPKTPPPKWRSHFPPVRTTPRLNDGKTRKVSSSVQNFTTEKPTKFDIGILDRYIYPDDNIFTTIPSEEFGDYNKGGAIISFPFRPTVTSTTNKLILSTSPKKTRVVVFKNVTLSKRRLPESRYRIVRPIVDVYRAGKPKPQKWLCYTCGLNETGLGSPRCDRVFESADQRFRGLRMYLVTKCKGIEQYTGMCFKRYLDIGGVYNERGCRNWPPVKGVSFASKRFMKLEYLLKHNRDGCVTSPHSTLTPFSRAVYLYARFHVCVCKGKLCNATPSPVTTPEWPLVGLLSLFWLLTITKQT